MRHEDLRLEKRMTINAKSVYLADLLSNLAKQSSVDIGIDEREEASGEKVSINASDTSLGDILNGVWSLLSNKDAQWNWVRRGEQGKYRYLLFPTTDVRDRVERYRRYVQAAYENYVDTLITLARMEPEDRIKNKKLLQDALLVDEDRRVDSLFEPMERWNAILLFAEVTPPAIQKRLLRGQQDFRISVREMAEYQQKMFHIACKLMRVETLQPDGSTVPVPEPEELHFYTNSPRQGATDLFNPLFFELGKGGGGVTIFGEYAMELGLHYYLRNLWLMPGETARSAYEEMDTGDAQSAPSPKKDASAIERTVKLGATVSPSLSNYPHAMENRLIELSQATSIPVIALLPSNQREHGSITRQKVGAYLEKCKFDNHNPFFKWRGKFLLVNYSGWFVGAFPTIPYEIVRICNFSKSGVITLPQLAKLISRVNEEQATELAKESPTIRSANEIRSLFLLYPKYPELITENGLALDAELLNYLRRIPLYASNAVVQHDPIERLRIHQFEVKESYGKGLVIRPEVIVGGKWVSLGGFIQIPN